MTTTTSHALTTYPLPSAVDLAFAHDDVPAGIRFEDMSRCEVAGDAGMYALGMRLLYGGEMPGDGMP